MSHISFKKKQFSLLKSVCRIDEDVSDTNIKVYGDESAFLVFLLLQKPTAGTLWRKICL